MEFDEVIDPSHTRKWLVMGLETISKQKKKKTSKRYIDSW